MEGKATNRSGWFWTLLCLCFVTASLFSENYILFHRDHDCGGEGCPVCLLIQQAENFYRQPKWDASFPGLFLNAILTAVFIVKFVVFRFIPLSVVQLKVKMNR
jgi:hypothetical protein